MNAIKVSYDKSSFLSKPVQADAAMISKRIGASVKEIQSVTVLKEFISDVSQHGHTFCPATFKDGKRNQEQFEQQQIFALDFDNKDPEKKVSFDDIKERADFYELPVLFAYDTLSSKNHDKFRVVFLNDIPITDRKTTEAMQKAIGTMFPEADPSCYKDPSKMYFGGKEVLYCDDEMPVINMESVFRNLCYCLKEKYKARHYKEYLAKFSRETGIALNQNGFLDVMVSDDPTEFSGVTSNDQNGGISPSTIIYSFNQSNIIADGENPQKRFYQIKYNSYTSDRSVAGTYSKKDLKNHNQYRSKILTEINRKCRLFNEFENGEKKLSHDELYGIATNLVQIDAGADRFLEIRSGKADFYDLEKTDKWKYDLKYMKQNDYKPQHCDGFCPYYKECIHGKNILSTVHPQRGIMEKISGYHEEFYPLEEVQEDTYHAICDAYHASGNGIWIIKSMTSVGKTTSYLKLMQENPGDRFLIAAPTNLLKDEICGKARKMRMKVKKTPSLEQIKDELPDKMWKHIRKLYKSGQYRCVHPYIYETLKKKNIPCLLEYIEEREALKNWNGSVITTHRYLFSMDEKRLREYDAVIIDEDIIFKSILPNQGEITLSRLEKLLKKTTDRRLAKKIKRLLKSAETQSCIEPGSFEWDYEEDGGSDDKPTGFDMPSFCRAEQFYIRRKSEETNLKKDTVTFLKPVSFKSVKYIMVSATADENICRNYFNGREIHFYECKRAAYQGELKQYPDRSMSRTCIENHSGIIQKLMERFHMDKAKVITFKKENIGSLHFGNTEGSNTLEGQDILVVGTPYHAEFLYKLAALEMGAAFDEDEKMKPQAVTHNGYQFWFTTFENEELREIHFWMLESELEQAVGRARLLRNACEVHLFSNFPLRQSQMISGFDYNQE